MYLKSLTLKGFKSFASSTTFILEPGITCMVGPNGSGKSNISDALSWVMGEQGAKNLRGGKMEDVIFAGSAERVSLGRAEVTLTIDNSDKLLPLDVPEVSITRRMFRDGISEYEINGQGSRLLDIQELLSDSGIGRELHVIVGQGQVADVLQSRPEERRSYIESAAGVLKHRKRKERSERKLQGTATNIARLTDLTTELRRQLKPLGKQAEAAKKAEVIAARLRDARLRVAADDIARQQAAFQTYQVDTDKLQADLAALQAQLELKIEQKTKLDTASQENRHNVHQLQETIRQLELEQERAKSTVRISRDRLDTFSVPISYHSADDPAQLLESSERAAEQEKIFAEKLAAAQVHLDAIKNDLSAHTEKITQAEQEYKKILLAQSDQREKTAIRQGRVQTLTVKKEELDNSIRTFKENKQLEQVNISQAQQRLAVYQGELQSRDNNEQNLNSLFEQGDAECKSIAELVQALQEQEKALESDIISKKATIQILESMLVTQGGTRWVLDNIPESQGSLREYLTIRPGYEAVISLILGELSQAVIMNSQSQALRAVQELHSQNMGRSAIIVADASQKKTSAQYARKERALPNGIHSAHDIVTYPESLSAAITPWLQSALIADADDLAIAHVTQFPQKIFYSRSGNIICQGLIIGGSLNVQSELESQSHLVKERQNLEDKQRELTQLTQQLAEQREKLAASDERVSAVYEALLASDDDFTALYDNLAQSRQMIVQAQKNIHHMDYQIDAAEQKSFQIVQEIQELQTLLAGGETETVPVDAIVQSEQVKNELLEQHIALREKYTQAQLTQQSLADQYRNQQGKAQHLARRAREIQVARQNALRADEIRLQKLAWTKSIIQYGERLMLVIEQQLKLCKTTQQEYAQQLTEQEKELTELNALIADVQSQGQNLQDVNHQKQLQRAQIEVLLQQLREQTINSYGISTETLLTEYGPEVPLPPTPEQWEEYEIMQARGEQVLIPMGGPYIREEQTQIIQESEAALQAIGTINPLALEEYTALEERYTFLATQLEDVKTARDDLLSVIREVEKHIEQVFTEAYHAVAREFEIVFPVLFPGGKGWLELTDPTDMKTTGIEIHARPPGKKVSRLSLLSGGERSLTALAFLVAIFRARPSPFYVMDEVEAALDETNLRRLIQLFQQLRDSSQLIIITHQKLMMEAADTLYGVSMRDDGITQVVSQRLANKSGV